MAVHYKFKSARDFDSVHFDGHFISVGNLKEKIFESKHLGKGTDFDLVVTNAQTNEEYLDEGILIPKNTSVLIRRVPGRPRMPIVTASVTENDEPKMENKAEDVQSTKTSFMGVDSSVTKYPEDSEWDEFGNDLYTTPEVVPVPPHNPVQDVPPSSKDDEDSKIKALINTPALDWQHQTSDGFGPGRGFGRGMGGRMIGGRGFGRGGLERKTPPPGYVCHRCKVPGHFIQHCPTNGDPNYDIKRVKPPTGIPKSMLMATPDGSYALPSGAVAVLKPNEAAFEKEIEGFPSTRTVGDLPPELHCPLCKEVMKDAVLTSKCCFKSFCDRCIRDYIISKSMCICGATSILADDLLPNKTLRDTINRIMESNNSSAENGGSAFQAQDMECRIPQPKIPSSTTSVASKGEQAPILQKEENEKMQEMAEQATAVVATQQTKEKGRGTQVGDASEATHMSMSVKEPTASQGSAPLADEEVQQKPISGEAGKKKKKKKPRLPLSAAEMQWKASQDLGAESYMMNMGPSGYNPYWNGMQPMFDGYMAPYTGVVPYMGYGMGPMEVPFGGVLPQDPFVSHGCMLPFGPPQRDLTDFGMGFTAAQPPVMSREEFEARKADLMWKREIERRKERELKNRESGREMSSGSDMTSIKAKSVQKSIPQTSFSDHHHHRKERSPDRHARDLDTTRPSSKRKFDYDNYQYRDHPDEHHHTERNHHQRDHHRSESSSAPRQLVVSDLPPKSSASASTAALDKKQKASVFSRISFPDEDSVGASKKRKLSSSSEVGNHSHRPTADGYHQEDYKRKSSGAATAVDYESSDDDRHFKRRPPRYEASPPAPAVEWEDEARHGRGSRERERGRDRGGYSSKLR